MTPGEREELRSVAAMWLGAATASSARLADALAPIIERMVAARIEALTAERDTGAESLPTP